MTILSDRQIRALCIAPTTVFNKAAFDKAVVSVQNAQRASDWPVGIGPAYTDKLVQKHTRETTEEERAAFVPMIAPFSPTQIKSVEIIANRRAYNEAMAQLIDEKGAEAVAPSDAEREALKAKYNVGATSKIISKGTTSYGYDVSLSGEFQIFTNVNGAFIDPKRPNPATLIDATVQTDEYGDRFVWLPPNSYLLGWTEEYFNIPRDVVAICVGKSTYARAGVQVNVTPIEPGFQGNVVIEIANSTSLPVKIYAHEGISQFLFLQGDEGCETSYADRQGKYQGQTGIVHATV